MGNVSKTFKCTKCTTDFPLSITTDLEITNFDLIAKCPNCQTIFQIYVGTLTPSSLVQSTQTPEPYSLDESIFVPPEMPSDEMKKLIEE